MTNHLRNSSAAPLPPGRTPGAVLALGLALSLSLVMPVAVGQSIDYKSIGAEPAVFYDAPSQRGLKLFVAPRGMPVEVIVGQGEWVRVRDAAGDFAWVERKALSDRRMLVAQVQAAVRSGPDPTAPIVFRVQKGVLLEMLKPVAAGWVNVRHADGASGFINAAEVWGE